MLTVDDALIPTPAPPVEDVYPPGSEPRETPWTCRCHATGSASTFDAAISAWRAHYVKVDGRQLTPTTLRIAVEGHAI